MKTRGITSGVAFARNPIALSGDWRYSESAPAGIFHLNMGGERIYDGRFTPSTGTPSVRVDISEIVDSFSSYFDEVPEGNQEPVVEIADDGELANRIVSAYFDYDTSDGVFECLVLPGGISGQNFRKYAEAGKDVFESRFLADDCNFFFTTRTSGWRIVMRETEIHPLYFLAYGNRCKLDIKELSTGTEMTLGDFANGLYALDVALIRRKIFDNFGVLASAFDIRRNGKFACRITIAQAKALPEHYRIKFRNSLGFYELMDMPGPLVFTPEYPDNDDSRLKRIDRVTGRLYNDRSRIDRGLSLTVNSAPLGRNGLRHLMDMVSGDDVWLLDVLPDPVKVIPTVDSFSYNHKQAQPLIIPVKLELAESETNISEEVSDALEARRAGIFSKTFNRTFN